MGIAHCALECKPKVDWNKGNASLLILEKEFGTEWEKRYVSCVSLAEPTLPKTI